MKVIFLVFVVSLNFFFLSDSAHSENTDFGRDDIIANISRTTGGIMTSSYLGQEGVATYNPIGSNIRKIYIMPYVKPDVQSFKLNLEESCNEKSDEFETHMYVNIELMSESFIKEISDWKSIKENEVGFVPYQYISISMGASMTKGGRSKVIYLKPNIESISEDFSGITVPYTDVPPYSEQVRIDETCGFFRSVSRSNKLDLEGFIIRDIANIKGSEITVSINSIVNNSQFKEWISKEGQAGRVYSDYKTKLNSGSGSGGIVGLFSIGASSVKASSRASIADTRRRWVSGSLIEAVAQDVSQSIFLERTRDSGYNDDKSMADIEAKILDQVFAAAERVKVRFEEREDGSVMASDEYFERILAPDQVDELFKAAREIKEEEARQVGVEVPNIVEVDTNDARRRGQRDQMTFKQKGGKFVPVSMDLYVVNEAQLRQSVKAQINNSVRGISGVGAYRLAVANNIKNQKINEIYQLVGDKFEKEIRRIENSIQESELGRENYTVSVTLDDLKRHKVNKISYENISSICGDEDGCLVTVTMKNYSKSSLEDGNIASRGPFSFFINTDTQQWRASYHYPKNYPKTKIKQYALKDYLGVNGDKNYQPVIGQIWGCLLSDSEILLDKDPGKLQDFDMDFGIMAYAKGKGTYPFVGKICAVHFRD